MHACILENLGDEGNKHPVTQRFSPQLSHVHTQTLSHHREVFFYSGYYYISLERKETLSPFSTEISAD